MPAARPEAPVIPPAELPRIAQAAPRPLKTDNFETRATDIHAAAIPAPAVLIKAAGFSGIETAEHVPARTISATGSFNSASSAANPGAERSGSTRASGFSDSSSSAAPSSNHRAISGGGFGDSSVALNTPGNTPGAAHKPDPVSALTAVEILFKPRPVYTPEARERRIEGEVLLEMQFGAAGDARLLRVVRGLGHGLDENAIAAAREIRFRPAERNGAAVDSDAIVHIVFQLAY
jgi:TonB family protein